MARKTAEGATPSPKDVPAKPVHPGWGRALVRVLLKLAAWAMAGVLAGAMLLGMALAMAYPQLPDIGSLTDYRPKLPLRVFSADGVLLGEYGEEKRIYTPISQIPRVMKEAVLAIEDANFYRHGGVDFKGVARAALAQLSEARSQGASTITMQVARNFYLSSEKTFTRKIYEVLLAFKIEALLEKDQILEVYMNQIFLGNRAYGFAAASEVYYGKPLQNITVAEAAMLAGLPKAPSAYNPLANPKRAVIRQRHIIERMLDNGFISEAQRDQARNQTLRYRRVSASDNAADHVSEMARQLVFAQYGEQTYSRGLHVQLTVDSVLQNVAFRALRRGLIEHELTQFYRGPEAFVTLPAGDAGLDEAVAEALADHPDNGELRAAIVLEVSPRRVVAMLQSGETVTVTGPGLQPAASGLSPQAGPKLQIRRGAVVRLLKREGVAAAAGAPASPGGWVLTQIPDVEGAFVAMDPRNGAIKALIGGFDHRRTQFNRVTQAWRQPGSSLKPFIYSAALEKGFSPATVVNDAPLFFDAAATGSQPWEPKNYDGKFDGPMSLRTGLARSKNMVAIRVLQSTGAEFTQQWLTRFGFEADKHPPYLTMALGAGAATPMQMATAYGVFANGGYRVEPQLIGKVSDTRGKVLSVAAPVVLDESLRTLEARNAFVMSSLLQEVMRSGTGARAQATLQRSDIYGKTGTTNDAMDAWFAGYHPSLVAVVWIGHDNPRKLGRNATGGGLSLPVWIEFMAEALKDRPAEPLEPPPGVAFSRGDWVYDEYSDGRGVGSLGLEDKVPKAPSSEERSGILDLFRR